jgi:hypothetical protein
MVIALYMDHHVPRAITTGLRLQGVDVVAAYEDQAHELDDARARDDALTSYPLYERAAMRAAVAPRRTVERFVADRDIRYW